jgi:GxxExxY protein
VVAQLGGHHTRGRGNSATSESVHSSLIVITEKRRGPLGATEKSRASASDFDRTHHRVGDRGASEDRAGTVGIGLRRLFVLRTGTRGHSVSRQVSIPVTYKGMSIPLGFRADILVDGIVILEIKAVPALLPAHDAQLQTYLRMSSIPIGLLLNFHAVRLKDDLRRFVG